MEDFFGIRTKKGDKVLCILNDEFVICTIVEEYLKTLNVIKVVPDNTSEGKFINNKNFINLKDIIKNNPQLFI